MTPFYYGWVIAGVAGSANFSRVSSAVEISSIFLPALVLTYGWSATVIASATTIGSIGSALAGPFIGRLLDRYGSRVVVPLGAFIVGLGCFALALTQSPFLFVGFYAIVRMAGQSMVMFPNSVTIAQWFERKRGTATAVMSAISATGLIIAPVVAQSIISGAGVGAAWAALGALALLMGVVPGLLLLARRPEDIGLSPDGDATPSPALREEAATAHHAAFGADYTLALALRTPALWAIVAVSFLVSGVMTGVSFHQLNYYTAQGIHPGTGSAIVAVYATGIAAGGVLWGWLADRIHVRYLLLAIYVIAAVLVTLLMGVTSPIQAFPIAFTFGTLVGGAMSIPTLLVADYYGRLSLGSISGVVYMARALGLGTGPLVAAAFYDLTQSYQQAFLLFVSVCVASAVLMVIMRRPARL
ncbi:MAG: MFS transporter [Dehalococcoidia bacterium]